MKIIYTRPDGGLSVVISAPGVSKEELLARSIPQDAIDVREIDDSEIPSDRLLRNAWVDGGVDIKEDKVKSQDIVRAARDAALGALDSKAFAESRRPGGNTATIDAAAQTLRNMPQRPEFDATTDTQTYKDMLLEIEALTNT